MEELIQKLRDLQKRPENQWKTDYQRAITDAIRVILEQDEEQDGGCCG